MSKSYKESKPIFIVGSGRGGTTLLFQLLHGHPDLAYITNLTDHIPALPQLALFSRIPGLRSQKLFSPSIESIPAFEYCGITEESLPLTSQDVNDKVKSCLQKLVAQHAFWSGKPRFINKNTSNTMRISFLREIFPDALFIYIIRNGYGVVNSLTRVNWWANLKLWWLDQTPAEWEANGGNRYELAALHWKKQVITSRQDLLKVPPDQYHECRYEELLQDPKKELKKILEFAGLEWNNDFQRHFDSISIRSDNTEKWRDYLDADARKAIYDASGDVLDLLGYDKS